ncbi:putative NAD(P)-binding-domain-containing protein, partial [Cantharellus anzutake]|uniref:putative NAD(P)-binding-domain-containing protein n=1 Tax=Cantharellus anzutake TaxID=1750568 RepID=UPI0019067049
GSLLLAWQLRGERVLIVGGGEVASTRLAKVLEADANVTLVAPSESLHPEIRYRIFSDPFTSKKITYHDRNFNGGGGGGDLEGVDMVLTAIDDVEISRSIYEHAHARKIPTNVADIPPSCDFYFGAQLRSGPLQVMVSTNGKGPKIASMVRDSIQGHVVTISGSGGIGEIVEKVGMLRERLRERAPGVGGEVSKKRMKWMVDLCNTWTLEELGLLDDRIMDTLLDEGWEK